MPTPRRWPAAQAGSGPATNWFRASAAPPSTARSRSRAEATNCGTAGACPATRCQTGSDNPAAAPAPPAQPVVNLGGIQGEKQKESQLALAEEGAATVLEDEEDVGVELAWSGLAVAVMATAVGVFARSSPGRRYAVTRRSSR